MYRVRLRCLTGKLCRHHHIVICKGQDVPTVLIGYFFQQEDRAVLCRGILPFRLRSVHLSIGMLRECNTKESLIKYNCDKLQKI